MRKFFRFSLWLLVAILVLAVGLVVYLRNADLSIYRDHIESFASQRIGHQLSIDGRFELNFGRVTRIVAEDLSLSNPEWQPDASLLEVGHVTVEFDTWSIVSGPFVVEDLDAKDIELRVEKALDGRTNWETAAVREPAQDSSGFDADIIAFREVEIDDAKIAYLDPSRPRPIHASIEHLTVAPDANDILDLDLRGEINELPLWADGKLGPWQNFLDGQDISADLDLTLGKLRLSLDGSLGDFRELRGVELNASLRGPHIENVIDRLALPPFASGEYAVDAAVQWLESGNQVRVEGNLGQIEIFASGTIDRLLTANQVQLDFSVAGPDTKYVAELFSVAGAPAEPFHITGDVARDGRELVLDSTRIEVGANSISVDGELEFAELIPNGAVTLSASGPNFSVLGPFIGMVGLPEETFAISGSVRRTGSLWQVDNIDATIGENRLTANGSVEAGSANTAQVVVTGTGPDISILQQFTDLQGLPSRPFDISARILSDPAGIRVEEGRGKFGGNRIRVDGLVTTATGLAGTSLDVAAEGPELRNVALLTGVPYLPDGPFEAAGNVTLDRSAVLIRDLTGRVGQLTAAADGRVGLGKELGSFELEVALQGPDLAGLATLEPLQQYAGLPFSIKGGISRRADQLLAQSLDVALGDIRATIDGNVIGARRMVDVTVNAAASDSVLLRKIAKLSYLPGGSVGLSGQFEMSESELELTDATLSVGEYRFAADGTLSLEPRSNDSDLAFSATGPSLKEVGLVIGTDMLPTKAFDISGKFDGTPSGFAMRDFIALIGGNDLHGDFNVDLRAKPTVSGRLWSSYLDVSERLQQAAEAKRQAAGDSELVDSEFLFSEQPLATSGLQIANANVELRVDRFKANTLAASDLFVHVDLQDGALTVDPIRFTEDSGSLEGKLSLSPVSSGYLLDAAITIDNVRMSMIAAADQDPATIPPLRGEINLRGEGGTVHAIMASSNGNISLRQGSGKMKEVGGSRIFGDLVLQVLRTLNPVRREDAYRMVDCGFYDVAVVDGIASIDRVAMQTDRMTMVASGKIEFGTEKLSITFRAKPREGIGISLGTVANSFLALGGTLKSPQVKINPRSSVTATGAAVATGGLSLLARGLWDRLSAESDICKSAAKSTRN